MDISLFFEEITSTYLPNQHTRGYRKGEGGDAGKGGGGGEDVFPSKDDRESRSVRKKIHLGICCSESCSGGQPGQGEVPAGPVHRLRVVRGRPFYGAVPALSPGIRREMYHRKDKKVQFFSLLM